MAEILRFSRRHALWGLAGTLAGCSGGLPASGPSNAQIEAASKPTSSRAVQFALLDVSPAVVAKMETWPKPTLQGSFGRQPAVRSQTIGVGDSVQVVIWEAAAGGLFSSPAVDKLSPGSRSASIPEQVVGNDGSITVPYAGRVVAAGRNQGQVEAAIVKALVGKAIEPAAVVTVTKNVSNSVTVIGEVTNGARVPLTMRGDRILDVIAAAGGIRAPTHEVALTLTRNGRSTRVPMQRILVDPTENISVEPGDVITVARSPQTFTAVGATGQPGVIPFEFLGISLEEAIGKAGGLNDLRADPNGVFVIRFEATSQYDMLGFARPSAEPGDKVPVIYRVNMRDPNSFFVARKFSMADKDILFVSNAQAAELQKLFSVINTLIVPAAGVIAVGAITR